jgi:hypothetical protein
MQGELGALPARGALPAAMTGPGAGAIALRWTEAAAYPRQ